MQRDRHHARLIVERTLHAIAMVHVKVDIEHLGFTGAQHMGNGNGNIVVDAEARGAFSPGMMPSTRGMKYVERASLVCAKWTTCWQAHHSAQRDQRTPSNERRCLVHAGQSGCISFTKTVTHSQIIAFLLAYLRLRYAELFDGSNVICRMYQFQFLVCSGAQR